MKKFILSSLILVYGGIYAQKAKPKTNKIDQNLVGLWKGSEKDQQIEGVEKLWIMERKQDGTFMLLFSQTDVYTYQVLDPSHIKFKSKEQSMEMATDNYTFIDTKIEEEDQ